MLADNRTRVSRRLRLATRVMKSLHTYLHVHRRKCCLNQEELAFLLGRKNASFISRFELRKRDPGLEAAFACQVLFDIGPSELFPTFFTEIEEAVMRRAFLLDKRLRAKSGTREQGKIRLLKAVLARARRRVEATEA